MDLKNLLNNQLFENKNVEREHQIELKKLYKVIMELQLELNAQNLLIRNLGLEFQKHPPFPWMDMAEITQTLNIAERTVHSYIQKGIIGRSKLGGKMYFNRKEIDEHLEKNYLKNRKK